MLKLGQIVVLMSASKPPNMKLKLHLRSEIEIIFDFACFFFEKKTARDLNDLDL